MSRNAVQVILFHTELSEVMHLRSFLFLFFFLFKILKTRKTQDRDPRAMPVAALASMLKSKSLSSS